MTTVDLRILLDEAKARIAALGLANDLELAAMMAELERKYEQLLVSEARIALTEAHLIVLEAMRS